MTEQELYEKLRDKVMNVMNEYPKEMFTSHNLKVYEAANASYEYEKGDELFWKWCDDEFYQFTEDLKAEGIDFNKQIEQIGTTSSFYLGNRHCDLGHYYSYSWTYEDMCQEMLEKITDYYTKNNASLDIIDDRVELYSRGYNDESMTDEEILNDLVSSLCEDMAGEVEVELHNQKVVYELLKEYKDNQVESFEQRVADYAYYNSEEEETEKQKQKVYVVEDVISGLNVNTETNVKVFSTEEKAIAYRNKFEEDYKHDYPDWAITYKGTRYFTMVGNDGEDEINVYFHTEEVDEVEATK